MGTPQYFDHSFEKEQDGKWHLFVNNRQDYEILVQQRYGMIITISNDASASGLQADLTISTINIFDNPPELSYNGPCEAKVS